MSPYKYCIVPGCPNTTFTAPGKIFFDVPRKSVSRAEWCKAIQRCWPDYEPLSEKSCCNCCEDHFDLEEDTENLIKYRLMNSEKYKVFLKLKKDVLPHIFPKINQNPASAMFCSNIKQEPPPSPTTIKIEHEEESWFEVPITNAEPTEQALWPPYSDHDYCNVKIGPIEIPQPFSDPTMSVDIKREPSEPIKTEPEETAESLSEDVAAAEPMKSERALLYAHHQIKDEIAIGPTQIQQPTRMNRSQAARQALALALHKHQRAAYPNACTTHQGNGFPAQLTAATDQRENALSCDSSLNKHKQTHSKIRHYLCDECGKSFTRKGYLTEHMQTHNVCKSVCDKCGSSFTHKSNFRTHMRIHSSHNGSKLFTCDTCGKSFILKGYLTNHIMRTHNRTNRSKVNQSFACSECGKIFTYRASLGHHMLIHKGSKSFSCVECGKSFIRKSYLTQHMIIHNESKPFECDECGKRFKRKECLTKHIKSIHRESQNLPHQLFACVQCGKSFAYKSYLSQHMLIHNNGYKPYTCVHCGKSFSLKSYLSQHMLIHNNGYKPFTCVQCGKSFSLKSDLSKHMRTHTIVVKNRPFACEKCHKRFIQKSHLSKHLLIHNGRKTFACV